MVAALESHPVETGWDGSRLLALRAAAGLSQKELAELAGTSQANVHRWEQGREPSFSHALALAAALGVDVNQFHAGYKRRRKGGHD